MTTCSESESKIDTAKSEFLRQTGAKKDICDSLEHYAELLKKWQKRFNLVGQSTLDDLWRRHFLDSAQLIPLIKNIEGAVVDLGSGAGFPGLVLSIMGIGDVHLVESDSNKMEFMRQVIRKTEANATLHRVRIEDYDGPKANTVTSRACAPLGKLLDYADGVCAENAQILLLKGRNWRQEVDDALAGRHFGYQCHPSCTDSNGVVLEIHDFQRR